MCFFYFCSFCAKYMSQVNVNSNCVLLISNYLQEKNMNLTSPINVEVRGRMRFQPTPYCSVFITVQLFSYYHTFFLLKDCTPVNVKVSSIFSRKSATMQPCDTSLNSWKMCKQSAPTPTTLKTLWRHCSWTVYKMYVLAMLHFLKT